MATHTEENRSRHTRRHMRTKAGRVFTVSKWVLVKSKACCAKVKALSMFDSDFSKVTLTRKTKYNGEEGGAMRR